MQIFIQDNLSVQLKGTVIKKVLLLKSLRNLRFKNKICKNKNKPSKVMNHSKLPILPTKFTSTSLSHSSSCSSFFDDIPALLQTILI